MTTVELKSELYRQIDIISGSEALMTKVLTFMQQLNMPMPVAAAVPYTDAELNARISASLNDIENGRTKKNEEVERMLTEEFEWLR